MLIGCFYGHLQTFEIRVNRICNSSLDVSNVWFHFFLPWSAVERGREKKNRTIKSVVIIWTENKLKLFLLVTFIFNTKKLKCLYFFYRIAFKILRYGKFIQIRVYVLLRKHIFLMMSFIYLRNVCDEKFRRVFRSKHFLIYNTRKENTIWSSAR